jgi:hypothetical protein
MKVDVSMKRISYGLRARDWAGSAAGFATVLAVLVMLDQRVAHKLSQVFTRGPSGEIGSIAMWAGELGMALVAALKDQSIDHAPILVFTAVAVLLVGFMVRT